MVRGVRANMASIDHDSLYFTDWLMRRPYMISKQLWYTKQNDNVKGPFPAGLISRYILLGRLKPADEVSMDGEVWTKISKHPELFPDVMKIDPENEMREERLKAARRWADEREINLSDYDENRRTEGGIESEDARLARFRAKMYKRQINEKKEERRKYIIYSILVFVAIAVLVPVGIYYASIERKDKIQVIIKNQENCATEAAPNVYWDNCQIPGVNLQDKNLSGASMRTANLIGASLARANLFQANLSYANLSGASFANADLRNAVLKGASLRGTKFNNANLVNADLSYADMSGADLSGARIENTRFDNAIWVNRAVCAPGSIGGCIPK